jgi:hypothetical protein
MSSKAGQKPEHRGKNRKKNEERDQEGKKTKCG